MWQSGVSCVEFDEIVVVFNGWYVELVLVGIRLVLFNDYVGIVSFLFVFCISMVVMYLLVVKDSVLGLQGLDEFYFIKGYVNWLVSVCVLLGFDVWCEEFMVVECSGMGGL